MQYLFFQHTEERLQQDLLFVSFVFMSLVYRIVRYFSSILRGGRRVDSNKIVR